MSSPTIELDARGLEPPQPLMKILEAVATLPEGATLRAHTRWRPALLYAQLEQRGFTGESEEQADGSYLTLIRRH
jgi:TusA-related sulfurtransferase